MLDNPFYDFSEGFFGDGFVILVEDVVDLLGIVAESLEGCCYFFE